MHKTHTAAQVNIPPHPFLVKKEKKILKMASTTPPSTQSADDVYSNSTTSSMNSDHRDHSQSQSTTDWEAMDSELRGMLSPVSVLLNSNSISTTEAANSMVIIVHEH